MELLAGDTALVTGAASGIGCAIAKALAAEGTRLVLSDIAEQAGTALARELDATFIAADLNEAAAPRRLFEAAVRALGSLSIFVHSASPKRLENETALAVTEAEWDSMTSVGLRAGFLLGQAAGAHMKARKVRGRMLFITSLHAYTPRNLPHYSATKAGQTMVVKELARALGADGVRVNAIAPGAIPGGGFDASIASFGKMIPLAALEHRKTSLTWRLLCCAIASRVTSPEQQSWSMAGSRSITGYRFALSRSVSPYGLPACGLATQKQSTFPGDNEVVPRSRTKAE